MSTEVNHRRTNRIENLHQPDFTPDGPYENSDLATSAPQNQQRFFTTDANRVTTRPPAARQMRSGARPVGSRLCRRIRWVTSCCPDIGLPKARHRDRNILQGRRIFDV